MRLTTSASASGSSESSSGLSVLRSSQAASWSSDSVAPAGLGYIATTASTELLYMKNDSPIGTSRRAQSSSGSEKSSSQTTRVPVGRRFGSPERWAQQVAQAQRIRRSFS